MTHRRGGTLKVVQWMGAQATGFGLLIRSYQVGSSRGALQILMR